MVNINLYPWREYERLYQLKRQKKSYMLGILFILSLIIIVHMILAQHENTARIRINTLNAKLNELQIINRVKPLQAVAVNVRNKKISISKMMEKLFPAKQLNQLMVCFVEVERVNKTYTLLGKARSMADLTGFLRHWNFADLFMEIQIKSLEKQENGYLKFGLKAQELDNVKS